MNDFSGYNQIKMYPEDERHTSFRTPLGVYFYRVVPFGLNNAGVTFQRAMNTIFLEHIRKIIKFYVDDLAMKSRDKSNHLKNLKKVFDIIQAHQLKMNPTKSFMGVASSKFLEFVVTTKGIHLNSKKVRAIQEMQPSRSLKELRSL